MQFANQPVYMKQTNVVTRETARRKILPPQLGRWLLATWEGWRRVNNKQVVEWRGAVEPIT